MSKIKDGIDEISKHELLDRISCINIIFESFIVDHPASSLLEQDIKTIENKLFNLYQKFALIRFDRK